MHAEKAFHAVLKDSAALLLAVPESKWYPGVVAQEVAPPALTITLIDSVLQPTIDAAAFNLAQARIQVTVHAKSYTDQKTIVDLVRQAASFARGSYAGVAVHRIVRDLIGPDLRNDDATLYRQSIDFLVTYTEA